ncbi:pentapeptide repeat-containing protein [Sulfitobacter sp. M368]|uniref:pentapeptide repeat-containing protein n=1 Tax=Sulfitobacter sp. M368 TaxID=2867021 RepID=UPI0021A91580|nr:pentapeptide repeat-containing protein [Sulfitobacter sp. M368]UWR16310.1 pentapeptide repeat-containing protein [Sulfitobacter sp. M368]
MSIYFKKPDFKNDWLETTKNLTFAAIEIVGLQLGAVVLGAGGNITGALDRFNAAFPDSKENHTTDERAWVWLYTTLSAGLYMLYLQVPKQQRIDDSSAKNLIKENVSDALAKITEQERQHTLTEGMLFNPADTTVLSGVVEKSGEIFSDFFVDQDTANSLKKGELGAALRAASSRVLALEPEYYQPLLNSVENTKGGQVDLNWNRHLQWMRRKFEKDSIFAIDENDEYPLSQTYLRSRCYWHVEEVTEYEVERKVQGRTVVDKRQRTELSAFVGDLHEEVRGWLQQKEVLDPLRIVTGGPGSGKSSFAKAFSIEASDNCGWRTVFIELQNMVFEAGRFDQRVGEHLRSINSSPDHAESAGFPQNPLDERSENSDPILLVFDGLDELSVVEKTATDLARNFVISLNRYLSSLNSNPGPAVKAIVLGRSAACLEGLRHANLPVEKMFYVAPLCPIRTFEDLGIRLNEYTERQDYHVRRQIFGKGDVKSLCQFDQREEYWEKWATLTQQDLSVPPAVTSPEMSDLNLEPLLLHLLILSGYVDERWEEARGNKNIVYREIFLRVLSRNEERQRNAGHPVLAANDALTALECMGLAAWRGGGRTGSHDAFDTLLEKYNPDIVKKHPDMAQLLKLDFIAIQFHARGTMEAGYEFIHKSFGEYLTACAILQMAADASDDLSRERRAADPLEACRLWLTLTQGAELTDEVVQFLVGAAKLLPRERALEIKRNLLELLNYVVRNGMPAHEVWPSFTYRRVEQAQRNAEASLVAVLGALANVIGKENIPEKDMQTPHLISAKWDEGTHGSTPDFMASYSTGPEDVLRRLFSRRDSALRLTLFGMDFRNAWLRAWNFRNTFLDFSCFQSSFLQHADFSNASCEGASFFKANLEKADFTGCRARLSNFRGARVSGASLKEVDFRNADLRGATFSGSNLEGADLCGADVVGVDFSNARLAKAKVHGSDLSKCKNLSQRQVNTMLGDDQTKLNLDRVRPPREWLDVG